MFVERLVHGKRAGGAEQNLIAVGRCLRHARGAGHAARAADIFEEHWLAQKLGEP
jgi:hypothetical protein